MLITKHTNFLMYDKEDFKKNKQNHKKYVHNALSCLQLPNIKGFVKPDRSYTVSI